MTTAREVFEDLATEHQERPGAGRRTMFGRDCLTVGGRNIAFFHDDRLALQLPPETAAALLAAGDGETPYMGKKPMRSWVAVALPEGPGGVERWRALVADAAAAVEEP